MGQPLGEEEFRNLWDFILCFPLATFKQHACSKNKSYPMETKAKRNLVDPFKFIAPRMQGSKGVIDFSLLTYICKIKEVHF